MLPKLKKSQFIIAGERGLPEHYPKPKDISGLLFYIQRNLNKNTVVYVLNQDNNGFLHEEFPMEVYWIKYTNGGIKADLNLLQYKAFGYSSQKIDNNTFEFIMDSHKPIRFFIGKYKNGQYGVITKINNLEAKLDNIYVYANEFGIFPKVEYIELYGNYISNDFPCYEKILI